MEQQWSIWKIVLTFLVGIGVVSLLLRRKSRVRLPPGPIPWPIIGNLPLLGKLPHQSLAKLAEKYGPIMYLKLGSSPLVVVSSPKVAEVFFKNHDVVWASRRQTTAAKVMAYEATSIGFTDYGPRWRHARKIFVLELLTARRLNDFQKTRKQEIISGINHIIDECCGGTKAVPMDIVIRRIGLNILTRMLMNEGVLDEKAVAVKNSAGFVKTMKKTLRLFGSFYVPDYVPWLEGFVQRDVKKEMYAAANKLDDFFQAIVDDHRKKLDMKLKRDITVDTQQDIVDTLLTCTRDDGKHLSEREMKSIMQAVILAGTDTTATTTEWGLSELLKNPHVMRKAQDEMDSVVGRGRLVEESDITNLPYLNAIVKETFRLHPAAPLLLPHVSGEACELLGYKFHAKTTVFFNVYAIQRDPLIWSRPLEFYPERFFDHEKDVHGVHFDLLPFGAGRRICPGKGLGLVQFSYSLALLLQTCDWSLPGEMKPEDLDMEECYGLTVTLLNPLRAIAVPRLPLNILRDAQI